LKISRNEPISVHGESEGSPIGRDDPDGNSDTDRLCGFVGRQISNDPIATTDKSDHATARHQYGHPIFDQRHGRCAFLQSKAKLLPARTRGDPQRSPIRHHDSQSTSAGFEDNLFTNLEANLRTPARQRIEGKDVSPIPFDRNHINAFDFVRKKRNLGTHWYAQKNEDSRKEKRELECKRRPT